MSFFNEVPGLPADALRGVGSSTAEYWGGVVQSYEAQGYPVFTTAVGGVIMGASMQPDFFSVDVQVPNLETRPADNI